MTSYETMLEMTRKDNPIVSDMEARETARRMLARPGLPSCCIHQMPEGMSSVVNGTCVRCYGAVTVVSK